MDKEQRLFRGFLGMHASKARPTEEPAVHLQWHSATLAADAPLVRLTRDEVLEELDATSELVRRLLEQMRTYDCTRQRIVGLVFDKQTVLSEVLRMPA